MEKYLIALTVAGIVDAISYMVVTPSLVFYVLKNGGTKAQYGLIMSAFSFSSFCTKPVIGWCSDKMGFRIPYFASLFVALLGGNVYFLASALPSGNTAVHAILAARLLGGCGAANSALGYAYVARSVPQSEQTSVNSLLSLCRILGMAVGPAVNILVSKIDIPITDIWGFDSLNSVGLILIISNALAMASIYFLLDEPPEEHDLDITEEEKIKKQKASDEDSSNKTNGNSGSLSSPVPPSKINILGSFLSMDIMVPMLSIFTFNANFQLIETGFAPAANDALGWGPVESSVALGSISFIIGANMFIVMQLSKRGVTDSDMLCGGLVASIVAYTAVYLSWIKDTTVWGFYSPLLIGCSSFPYLAAPTRSIFTVAVNTKPALRKYHGSMQAVLSMAASVAGFVTPGLVAAYCLRHPEEVVASSDKKELTPYSLFAPVLSLLTLLGMVYLRFSVSTKGTDDNGVENHEEDGSSVITEDYFEDPESESTSLLPSVGRNSGIRRGSSIGFMLEGPFDGFERSFRENSARTMDEIGS